MLHSARENVMLLLPMRDGQIQNEAEQNRLAGEIQHGGGPGREPRGPRRERGDRSEILSFVIGVVVGGLAGTLVAYLSDSVNFFQGLVLGVVLGGIVGAVIGGDLKKRVKRRVRNDQ